MNPGSDAASPTRPRRGRWAVAGVRWLGLVVVFVTSLVLGVAVHGRLETFRRVVRTGVNQILASELQGSLRLGAIVRLDPSGIEVAEVSIDDPDGRRVLTAEGVVVDGNWIGAALALGLRGGASTLVLPPVRIARGEVDLVRVGDRLALELAVSSKPKPRKPEERPRARTPSRFGLTLSDVAVGEVVVRGEPADGVRLDGRVTELRAGLWLSPERFALDVRECLVEEREVAGVAWSGKAGYHLRVPLTEEPAERDVDMWGTFAGDFGAIPVEVEAHWIGGRIALDATLPRVEPSKLAALLPALPLRVPVSLTLSARGDAQRLETRASLALHGVEGADGGLLLASGQIRPGLPLLFDAHLDGRGLDARALSAEAPATSLRAAALARGRVEDGGASLRLSLRAEPGRVAGQLLPAIEGTLLWSEGGGGATLVLHEPGMTSDLDLRLEEGGAVGMSVRGEAADLTRFPRLQALLGAPVAGRLRLDGEGRFQGGELDLGATVEAAGVTLPSAKLRAGHTRVRARLRGPLDALAIDARGRADALDLNGRAFDSLEVSVLGPLDKPAVHALLLDDERRELEARGLLDPARGQLEGVSLELRRDSTTLGGRVGRLAWVGGELRVDGIALEGLGGAVDGSLQVSQGELWGKLQARDVDLAPLSKLLGLPYRLRGRAKLDIDLARVAGGRRGHARIELEDVGMLVFGGIDLSVSAGFEGARVTPELTLSLSSEEVRADAKDDPCAGRIATIHLQDGEIDLAGALLDPDSWLASGGRITLRVKEAKLPCLAETWQQVDPTHPLPLERREGVVDARVALVRPQGQLWPSLEGLELSSRGLALAPPPGKDGKRPWTAEHMDVHLRGGFEGDSREGHLELKILDRLAGNRELGSLVLDATLDLEELLADPKRARSALENMPVSAHLRVARIALGGKRVLPEPLATTVAGIAGEVEANAYMEGTARDPSLGFRIRTWDLAPADRGPDWDLRTDVDVIGSYHDGVGRVDALVARRGQTVATVAGESEGNLSARLLGGSDPRWTGWIEARLLGLPLESLPPLADLDIAGEVSGIFAVRGLGRAPEVQAQLSSPALRIGEQVVLEHPDLTIAPIADQPGGLTVEANLPVRGGGRLDVRGYGTVDWVDALYPRPDLDRPAALYLVSNRFPLGVLKPALGEEVTRLEGRLDGELRFSYREFYERELAFDVDMKLSEGVVHIPAFGQELHDVSAHVSSTPGLVRIEDISASSSGGRAQGWLLARTRGSGGFLLRDLTGALVIAREEPMPLVLEGMPIGSVSGTLMLNATPVGPEAGGAFDVKLTAAGLHIQLPPSPAHGVQDLGDHGDVRISQPVAPPKPEEVERTIPLSVTIALVNAEIEGSQIRVLFGTNPERPVKISVERDVTGEILLSGGELSLLDKTFTIDRGVVRLEEASPGNPYVNVTAHWAAPEGTVVYVDYIGQLMPLTREKIRFRSEPPRSEGELLALLVFGESRSGSARDAGANERAGGLGSGIAASQFNAILGEVAPGLSTSVSSSEGYVSTTVTYRFTDRVSASATYENVSASGGTAPPADATSGTPSTTTASTETTSRTKLSIDWRFAPSWLLRSTFGLGEGASSGVDLLFQHRYE